MSGCGDARENQELPKLVNPPRMQQARPG